MRTSFGELGKASGEADGPAMRQRGHKGQLRPQKGSLASNEAVGPAMRQVGQQCGSLVSKGPAWPAKRQLGQQ